MPDIKQGRVIAGVNALKGAWPWQILMLNNGRPMCGGSLVSPTWVVTAAHCVSGRSASSFKIRYNICILFVSIKVHRLFPSEHEFLMSLPQCILAEDILEGAPKNVKMLFSL